VQCTVFAPDRNTLDITNDDQVRPLINNHQPDAIINAAAYTDVDQAENEPDRAFAVNADGTAFLAEAARDAGAHLIHLSTDFVFDGHQSHPYQPDDEPAPINMYGKSKLAGEQRVQDIMGGDACIVRTAWLYGGNERDFLSTMLRLMRAQPTVQVVADQVGTPTEVTSLARALWMALDENLTGVHHWTNAGVASWYDFAVAIAEEAQTQGLVESVRVVPVSSNEFSRPAARPSYTVLGKRHTWRALDVKPEHWRHYLRQAMRATEFDRVNA